MNLRCPLEKDRPILGTEALRERGAPCSHPGRGHGQAEAGQAESIFSLRTSWFIHLVGLSIH